LAQNLDKEEEEAMVKKALEIS